MLNNPCKDFYKSVFLITKFFSNMKKKLLPGIVALAVLLIAGLGMNRGIASYGDLSDVALQNVLALADGEDWGDPDPGESGDEVKLCGTRTTSEEITITCNGRFITATNFSFECTSSGDHCKGVSGYVFICGGERFDMTSVDQKFCI